MAALKRLTSTPHLRLVARPQPDCCTRPASCRHLDNAVLSRTAETKIAGPLEYIQLNPHWRVPSDHLCIILPTTPRAIIPRAINHRTQFNTLRLQEDSSEYERSLRVLSTRWSAWTREVREAARNANYSTTSHLLHVAHEGIKFIVRSASAQTLGTRRIPVKNKTKGTMSASTLKGKSKDEMWATVKMCLAKDNSQRIPYAELEAEMREHADKRPDSKCVRTRKWVDKKCRVIDELQANLSPDEATIQRRAALYVRILEELVHKMDRDVAAGPDGIQALQLKHAPREFLGVIAQFIAWCVETCLFPLHFQLAKAVFIPRPDGRFRGLRLQDLITKLGEQLVLDPIFPAVGPKSSLIAPEQMAGKKGISAEHVSVLLSLIIEASGTRPLYIIISDVLKAYDLVWRRALWAKLADAHPSLQDVKAVEALYRNYVALINDPDYRSEIIAAVLGLPQGGPRSGDCFCFFTSDLPEELKASGAGVLLFEVFLVCAIIMDDYMIPVFCENGESTVIRILESLRVYGLKWSLTWALPKLKVLCYNVTNPPSHWPYGEGWIETVVAAKYLSVLFHTSRSWDSHFATKITAANIAAAKIREAGLLGGSNVPNDSLEIIRAIVWATLDYGRAATLPRPEAHAAIDLKLQKFQTKLLREALSLSRTAPIDGVLGEAGEMLDTWREAGRILSVAHQMLTAPEGSLVRRIAVAAEDAFCNGGLFSKARQVLERTDRNARSIQDYSRNELKKTILGAAEKEWKVRVASSRRLRESYSQAHTLSRRGYLGAIFPGRLILLKLRVDDLALGASRWVGLQQEVPTCSMCRRGPETRQHFVLDCRALQPVRDTHVDAMLLCASRPPDIAFKILILAHPAGAVDNVPRAKLIGALLWDLWKGRCERLGLRLDGW